MADNFNVWWSFCMAPNRDGNADDTSPGDGAGPTRWGWTYPTWVEASRWVGAVNVSTDTFMMMDRAQAGALAQHYFWNRLILPLPNGSDVSVMDWLWNSGRVAVMEIQRQLGGLTADGIIGPHTIASVQKMGEESFISSCYSWRIAFLNNCGFQDRYPGLYTRADDCRVASLGLIGVVA